MDDGEDEDIGRLNYRMKWLKSDFRLHKSLNIMLYIFFFVHLVFGHT